MRITVANTKGGTGKTSVHLAALLGRRGSTVLIDADPQGSATRWAQLAGSARALGASGRLVRCSPHGACPVLETEIPMMEAYGWGYGMVPPEGHRYGQLLDELLPVAAV